jgi:hypothetical protein
MVTIHNEDQYPYENLDRLVSVVMRPQGLSSKSLLNSLLYQQAKSDYPISYDIVNALSPELTRKIGIFTGASDPTHYPNGENDGPLGTIILAEALRKIGHDVSIFIDPQLAPIMNALSHYFGHPYNIIHLNIDVPDLNTAMGDDLDVAIAVEKAGTNPAGLVHSITGYTREGTRAKVDGLFSKLVDRGGISISVCDGVNEIGFGNIYDVVAKHVPWTTECRCGCDKGVMCSTTVTHLYPTAISNWGAYALTGAFALWTGNVDLIHTPDVEAEIEQIAVEYDVRDGTTGKACLYMDGVPLAATQSMLVMMRNLVEISLRNYIRPF